MNLKNKKRATLGAILITFGLLAGGANAAITVTITGTTNSSIVNVAVSGSGTWQIDSTSPNIGWGSGWSSDFATAIVQNGTGFDLTDGRPFSSGVITLVNNGVSVNVGLLSLDSDGVGTNDDFVFFFPPSITIVAGETYSWSGSATFDLDSVTSGITIEDLVLGTHTNTSATQDAPITLVIVPEPSSALFFGFAGLSFMFRRSRR